MTRADLEGRHIDGRVLDDLHAVIEGRRGADPAVSYSAKLLHDGVQTIARKVGEEAVETVIAALMKDKGALAAESADLLYHLLALWAARGLEPGAVWAALDARRGTSGIAEKAARTKD